MFRNFDPVDGEWHHPDASDLRIVVKIFDSEQSASAVAARLEADVHVQARVIGEYIG